MGLLTGKKVAFLGGGAMAEAILTGMIKAGLTTLQNLLVSDPQKGRRDYLAGKLGVKVTDSNVEACSHGDLIILAVKPFMVEKVLREAGNSIKAGQIVVSIAAGIESNFIAGFLAPGIPVIRIMPNTPCLVGEGASALALGNGAGPNEEALVREIFGSVGRTVTVKEEQINAVTGLSGSGPAYMYVILEALADGAVNMGLSCQDALTLAAQTMLGAAKMVLETGEHPGKLKDMVTTPGGTTIAGLYALEKKGLRGILMKAVKKAAERAAELDK